ncbi:MAG TPA: hypothetical protein VMU48_19760 [Terracidiphilus sp.]|nr:hypothetical protein [Terracidiphilus sp.]
MNENSIDQDSRIEIIKHLSSEIKTQSAYLSTLRSRVALTILVGPFVVFGSFLVAIKGAQISPHFGEHQRIYAALAIGFYLAMGLYGALLDGQVTKQCDEWRGTIVKLAKNHSVGDNDLKFKYKHYPYIAYMIGWICILGAFISIALLLASLLPPVANCVIQKY